MTVKFNIVERGNPSNLQAPKKFYPSVVASGRKTLRQIAKRIAEISTISNADTMAVIEAFLTVVPQELAEGNIVELGDFGNFWLKINSSGMANPEQVNATNITNVLPRFNPGKEFKKVMITLEFQRGEVVSEPEPEPESGD